MYKIAVNQGRWFNSQILKKSILVNEQNRDLIQVIKNNLLN